MGTAARENRKDGSPLVSCTSPVDAHQITYGSTPIFVAVNAHPELRPKQIFDLLAERRDTTEDELVLIEMRYQ